MTIQNRHPTSFHLSPPPLASDCLIPPQQIYCWEPQGLLIRVFIFAYIGILTAIRVIGIVGGVARLTARPLGGWPIIPRGAALV